MLRDTRLTPACSLVNDMSSQSTKSAIRGKSSTEKPEKPYPDFPLFPHATRRWAKKIRGKLYYFGPWDDPDGSLTKYLRDRDDLYAGRQPRPSDDDALVVRELCNCFLTNKRNRVLSGELSKRSFDEYYATTGRAIDHFGKRRRVDDLRPEDFESYRASIAKRWGVHRLSNEVTRVRSIFKYAFDEFLVERPVRFGQAFKGASRRVKRIARQKNGQRMFETHHIRALIDEANPQLRLMILLAVNCGFGNTDCAKLSMDAIDIKDSWVDFPRPKTGIERRCPLWTETATALRAVIENRPAPSNDDDANLVFVTKYGNSWLKDQSSISKEFRKLMKVIDEEAEEKAKKAKTETPAKLYRKGRTFYALRHTFETIGGESRDQVAVDFIMGHTKEDMASVYRERISDERLRAVVDCVHLWLFADETK